MNQLKYQRTALGQQEILERNLKIPSRARTLLLLIESYDLQQLDTKIANPEYFDILLRLGLITTTAPISVQESTPQPTITAQDIIPQNQASQEILPSQNLLDNFIQSHVSEKSSEQIDPVHNLKIKETIYKDTKEKNLEVDLSPLSFLEIQTIMQKTLQQYCGLMAKNLIDAIAKAETTEQLRKYQKKWLTDLFETRITRQELAILKDRINFSIQRLENIPEHL